MPPPDTKFEKAARLTFIGIGFVTLGAILNAYVPAFHKPVKAVDDALKATNDTLAKIPVMGVVFKDNPLTNNDDIREFLAVNVVESGMVGSIALAGGALLKLMGVTPHQLQEKMRRFDKGNGGNEPGKSP